MNKTTFCATSYIGENKFFPYRCLWDNGVDYLMDTHGSLQVTSLNDPPGCGLFQAKILEPEHLAAHKATCKKWTATSQPRQAWDSSCKSVLGGQIKPLLRHTNHGVSRNNKNEPRTRILITQRNYHKKKKKAIPTPCHLPSKNSHTKKNTIFLLSKSKNLQKQNLLKPSLPVTFQTSEKKADKKHLEDLLLWMRSFTMSAAAFPFSVRQHPYVISEAFI